MLPLARTTLPATAVCRHLDSTEEALMTTTGDNTDSYTCTRGQADLCR